MLGDLDLAFDDDDRRRRRQRRSADRRPDAQYEQPPGGAGYGPEAGQPAYGHPGYGQPSYGQPGQGQPAHSQPAHSQPAHSQPGYGQAGYGQPGYGGADQGWQGYGEPGQSRTGHSQAGYGQPGYGPDGYGPDGYGPDGYGPEGGSGYGREQARPAAGYNQDYGQDHGQGYAHPGGPAAAANGYPPEYGRERGQGYGQDYGPARGGRGRGDEYGSEYGRQPGGQYPSQYPGQYADQYTEQYPQQPGPGYAARGGADPRRGAAGEPGRESGREFALPDLTEDDGPRPPKRRRGRSFLALFMAFALLAILGAGGFYGYTKVRDFFTAPDYATAGSGEVHVKINTGDSATEIGQTLQHDDVVKSVKAYTDAAVADPQSKNVQPGLYKLAHKMKASKALDALLATNSDGTLTNKISFKVTVPEGMISADVFAQVSKVTKIPVADLQNAAKDPTALGVPDWWFNRTDGKQAAKTIEGFLYPATYEFDPGVDAHTVLSTMVAKFNTENGDLKFSDTVQSTLKISPYEGLVAASIAQAEAPLATDMSKVTRVLYNRVYGGSFPCSCLQLDSTVNYYLRISGREAKDSRDLTDAQLHDKSDPYNTHDVTGMPIGPISNPGTDALKAAMAPADGNWVFFVTIDKQGHTAFSDTNAQFQRDVATAKKNGVL